MYQYDEKPSTRISEASAAVLDDIRQSEYSVLVGRNNCGKSFLLKTLTQKWGTNASYLGPARYQNFNLLGYYTPNRSRKEERWRQFLNQFSQKQQNIDNSPVNLQQAIAELSNAQRSKLSEIVETLLKVPLEIRDTVEDNDMSQKYISCGGHNISYTSSGFRLITTLITSLLDEEYDTFLIDEPELGISPEAQGVVADFLFDKAHRSKYFPHLRTLVLATHSTVFLDRVRIQNNYKIEKRGDEISVRRAEDQSAFNEIHFFLLGNRFETLYLPSVIILVEGKSDLKFIERVVGLKYPTFQMSVIAANTDSRIKEILTVAKSLLADIQRSPYRDRIFVVLDAVHAPSLPEQLVSMGIPRGKIVVWPLNGIEFYYPPTVIDEIYGTGTGIEVSGDDVSRNGITYKKGELADRVVSRVNRDTEMHSDFQKMFLSKIDETLGLERA